LGRGGISMMVKSYESIMALSIQTTSILDSIAVNSEIRDLDADLRNPP
jgi:hypothetical protein